MRKRVVFPILILSIFLFLSNCEKSADPLSSSEIESTSFNVQSNCDPTPPPPPPMQCAATPGYWKNHPDEWPVEVIKIGDTYYRKADAIALLNMPEKGDKTITLFRAAVATKLNLLRGSNPACIENKLYDAMVWLKSINYPVLSGVKANDPAWKYWGEPLYLKLDAYNNGMLCAPGCD